VELAAAHRVLWFQVILVALLGWRLTVHIQILVIGIS
jgi:hypothetical protein